VSPEAEERAFRTLLDNESRKARSLVQELSRGEQVAVQALSLARVQYDRALRELPGAAAARDFDQPYLSVYRALISGCKALIAAYGYRVHGGDGAHYETLRLAALGLAASESEAGTLLETIREPIRNARNEAEYQRPGVTTAAELRQLFEAASTILPAVARRVTGLAASPTLPIAEAWPVPEMPQTYPGSS
jgi:hypothetical protein